MTDPMKDAKGALGGLGKEIGGVNKQLKPINKSMPGVTGSLKNADGVVKKLSKKTPNKKNLLKSIPPLAKSLKALKTKIDDITDKLTAPKSAIEGLVSKQKDVFKIVKPVVEKGPLAIVLKKKKKDKELRQIVSRFNNKKSLMLIEAKMRGGI